MDTVNNVLTAYVDHLTVFAAFSQTPIFSLDAIIFIVAIVGVSAVVIIAVKMRRRV